MDRGQSLGAQASGSAGARLGLAAACVAVVGGLAVTLIGQAPQATPSTKVTVIKAARLLDGQGGAPLANPVVVEGERIARLGANLTVPAGADVVDLGTATLLPGLIDCHTHLTDQPGENYYDDMFRKSPIDSAVIAHVYARRTLEAGFTTVRDVGAGELVDVAMRNAINRGEMAGPRMQVATLAVSATGGHGDLSGFSPYLSIKGLNNIADGVDEIRKLVRTEVKYGADLIKVAATAGVLSEEESVGAPRFSQEELNALVEEAHMWEKRVAAHAHGTEGIKRAIVAGVTSVEHASFIDDEGIRLAREKGTWLVMVIYHDDYILAEFSKKGTHRRSSRRSGWSGVRSARTSGKRSRPGPEWRLDRMPGSIRTAGTASSLPRWWSGA